MNVSKIIYSFLIIVISVTLSCEIEDVLSDITNYPEMGDRPDMGDLVSKYVRAVRDIDNTKSYGVNVYTDNNDDTITDSATGLMWTKYDNSHYDLAAMDWEDALNYSETSNIAEYDDWRLPNIKELQSIVDYSYAPNALDSDYDGPSINPLFDCSETINESGSSDYGYYWSSTSALFQSGGNYYYAWYVAFGMAVNSEGKDFHGAGAVRFDTKYEGGEAGEDAERYYNYVRLVRDTGSTANSYPITATGQVSAYDLDGNISANILEGSSLYGQDAHYYKGTSMSFTDNTDYTITDNNTGLMWEQIPDTDKRVWSDATEYCSELNLGGYDDWRVPTLKELFSISDFNTGWPYLDNSIFELIGDSTDKVDKSEQYWSSIGYVGETVEGGYNASFGVNHATGHIKAYASGM